VPEHGGAVIELVVRPGHVHLFAHFSPTPAPQQIMAGIKGRASHALRREVPALRLRLPSLWTHSFYVATVGSVSSKTVRTYLAVQKGV
jgi:putative transposase